MSNAEEPTLPPNMLQIFHTVRRMWTLSLDEARELTGLKDATVEELIAAVTPDLCDEGSSYPNDATESFFEEPEEAQDEHGNAHHEDFVLERTAMAHYHPSYEPDYDPSTF